jgi:hypothetical protein
VKPLRRLQDVAALVLHSLGGKLADLRIELALLEIHRRLQLRYPTVLPVDLAEQDDDDNEQDGGQET